MTTVKGRVASTFVYAAVVAMRSKRETQALKRSRRGKHPASVCFGPDRLKSMWTPRGSSERKSTKIHNWFLHKNRILINMIVSSTRTSQCWHFTEIFESTMVILGIAGY